MCSFGRFLLSGIVALSMLSGCTTTQENATKKLETKTEPALDIQASPGVEINYADTNVAHAIVVSGAIRPYGNLSQLSLLVKNLTQVKFRLEYRVQWFDEMGVPSSTSPGWQSFFLTGNMAHGLMNMGKTINSKTAKVTFRFPVDVEIYVPEPDPMEQMKAQQELQRLQLEQMRRQVQK